LTHGGREDALSGDGRAVSGLGGNDTYAFVAHDAASLLKIMRRDPTQRITVDSDPFAQDSVIGEW
jgi:hypothetical protein